MQGNSFLYAPRNLYQKTIANPDLVIASGYTNKYSSNVNLNDYTSITGYDLSIIDGGVIKNLKKGKYTINIVIFKSSGNASFKLQSSSGNVKVKYQNGLFTNSDNITGLDGSYNVEIEVIENFISTDNITLIANIADSELKYIAIKSHLAINVNELNLLNTELAKINEGLLFNSRLLGSSASQIVLTGDNYLFKSTTTMTNFSFLGTNIYLEPNYLYKLEFYDSGNDVPWYLDINNVNVFTGNGTSSKRFKIENGNSPIRVTYGNGQVNYNNHRINYNIVRLNKL